MTTQDPTINQNVSPNQPSSDQPAKKKNTCLIAGLIIGGCLFLILIIGIISSLVLVNLGSSKNKAKEARVKAGIVQLGNMAEQYYDENNTYVGWSVNQEIKADIANLGSSVNSLITPTNYVVWTKLLSNNQYICIDSNGQLLNIKQPPTTTSCQ